MRSSALLVILASLMSLACAVNYVECGDYYCKSCHHDNPNLCKTCYGYYSIDDDPDGSSGSFCWSSCNSGCIDPNNTRYGDKGTCSMSKTQCNITANITSSAGNSGLGTGLLIVVIVVPIVVFVIIVICICCCIVQAGKKGKLVTARTNAATPASSGGSGSTSYQQPVPNDEQILTPKYENRIELKSSALPVIQQTQQQQQPPEIHRYQPMIQQPEMLQQPPQIIHQQPQETPQPQMLQPQLQRIQQQAHEIQKPQILQQQPQEFQQQPLVFNQQQPPVFSQQQPLVFHQQQPQMLQQPQEIQGLAYGQQQSPFMVYKY